MGSTTTATTTMASMFLATICLCSSLAFIPTTQAAQWSPTAGSNHNIRSLKETSRLVHDGNGAFLDGTETMYEDFSLAWRFLGFFTDCNVCLEGGNDNNDNNNNDNQDFREASECIEDGQETVCRKYALWAAYVDEGYTDTTEYQYYDRKHKRWDDSQCQNENENDDARCVKMDCHDPFSKNFQLLGVYKDPKIDEFLETMRDYSGDCVWNDDEYKFMQAMNNNNENNNENNNVDYWPPKTCTALPNNNKGYYDAVPTAGGNLELAIYSDASCTTRYDENDKNDNAKLDVDSVLGRSKGDLESWNRAMDAFKICQPCVSYDTLFLSNKNFNKRNGYNANGDRYAYNQQQQNNDDDENDNKDNYFVCQDNLQQDEPTNQCQVLLEGDGMKVATYRDILLAESQGSVTGIDLSSGSSRNGKLVMGEPFVKSNHKWLSVLLLILSMVYFVCSLKWLFDKDRSKNSSMEEPLVRTSRSTTRQDRSSSSNNSNKKSSKSVATTAAVASRKNKEEKAQKKQQQQQQQPKKKKSILKKSKYNSDDDDGYSQESTHYSKFQL